MKPTLLCIALAALTSLAAGCKKSPSSHYGKDEPIEGSRSDPSVALQASWSPSNRYHFQIQSITAAEEPRRNTTDLVTRETTFGEEFALAVTNVAADGSRILELEIQGLQIDSALGERVTVNFDSGNESLDMNSRPVTERLQKLIGSRLAVHLTPENRVRRVDGLKEINDALTERVSTNSTRNVVRGAAGNILSRFFTQQFWREMLEMSALPTNDVRIGDTWTVTRPISTSPGGNLTADLTYTFKGWQQHDERRCARLEFSGTVRPQAPGPRNRGGPGNPAPPPPTSPQPGAELGTITGVTWFSPDLALPVETVFDQTTTSKITSARRVRVVAGTNASTIMTLNPSPPPGATNSASLGVTATNGPIQTVTATTRQHVSLKLVEVTPYTPAPSK